jgi:hypothetical protein
VAIEQSSRDQAVGAIDEYLVAAGICIKTTKPNGGMCATDAIGHGVLPANGDFTRLDVLADPLFGSVLTVAQAKQVKEWYRNCLVHSAMIAVGVNLEADAQGKPFEFDTCDAPVLIRVGKLYEIVSNVWARMDKATFSAPPPPKQPDPHARLGSVFTFTAASSGVGQAC